MKSRITILGGGESGVGAALLAKARGYEVFVSDSGEIETIFQEELSSNAIPFETGKHSLDRVVSSDTIIKSPGIPESSEIMMQVRAEGVEVISEIEFAYRHTKASVIGITGTNGKTTTTQLIYHLLKSNDFNVAVCGNIGTSMSRTVLKDTYDWLVVELSSFQLDDIDTFHPRIAVILNITPDHLNRYNDFDDYVAAKWNLFKNLDQEDEVIYWLEDPVVGSMMGKQGVSTNKTAVSVVDAAQPFHKTHKKLVFGKKDIKLSKLPFTGDHNYINCLCAVAAAMKAGAGYKGIKLALKTFTGIPHRMEYVGSIDDVAFVNDSKATNVEAVYYALDAYPGPITWIAGGVDKGNDYSKIMSLVKKKVKTIICLGIDNEKLKVAFGEVTTIHETQSIAETVELALRYSAPKTVVLLSPACASFDLFSNYEDRGDQFREAVLARKTAKKTTDL